MVTPYIHTHIYNIICNNTMKKNSIFLLLLLFCTTQAQPKSQGGSPVVAEEKNRLGSTPPSCHNKCNTCHPCMAVQVPTMPAGEPVRPGHRSGPDSLFDSPRNRYSNYKPLGWKCRCGDHLFNP